MAISAVLPDLLLGRRLTLVAMLLLLIIMCKQLCLSKALEDGGGPSAAPPSSELSRTERRLLFADLVDREFFRAVRVFLITPESVFTTDTTLLVPSDAAMALSAQSSSTPKLFHHVRFHTLARNLSLEDLRAIPQGTWISSKVPGLGVQVTENTASFLSLNNAAILRPNICPNLAFSGVTCHGIDRVLDESSIPSDAQPVNPPFVQSPSSSSTPVQNQNPTPTVSPLPKAPSPPSPTVGNVTNIPSSNSSPVDTPSNVNSSSGIGLPPSLLGPLSQSFPNSAIHISYSIKTILSTATFVGFFLV
ncbi:hypothetical protein KP509_13G082200 [Ceratopteris richardii]|uniref:FAS1 domain-containing protein n=1 Tax=Ceratopteris richardii TaxID=49495 RepID=A0A8T2TKH5_CERRI|nr:hypothetical protein KP509_13G082200 [Ceratopteris richardii]